MIPENQKTSSLDAKSAIGYQHFLKISAGIIFIKIFVRKMKALRGYVKLAIVYKNM